MITYQETGREGQTGCSVLLQQRQTEASKC